MVDRAILYYYWCWWSGSGPTSSLATIDAALVDALRLPQFVVPTLSGRFPGHPFLGDYLSCICQHCICFSNNSTFKIVTWFRCTGRPLHEGHRAEDPRTAFPVDNVAATTTDEDGCELDVLDVCGRFGYMTSRFRKLQDACVNDI